MPIVDLNTIKSKFEAGDRPGVSDYINMIDTLAATPDISGKQDVISVATQSSWTGAVTLTQSDSLVGYIKKQLTGNTTVTVSDGVSNKSYSCSLELQQDATGSRTIILKGCRTAYGVPLVLTTTANAIDIVRLEWNGTSWTAFMGAAQISVPSAWV